MGLAFVLLELADSGGRPRAPRCHHAPVIREQGTCFPGGSCLPEVETAP